MSTPSTPALIPKPQTLYFAYGSNLSHAQMQTRCPDSTYVGMGILQNHRWIVNQRGYANIVFCGDSGVQSQSDFDAGEGEGEDSGDEKDFKNENENTNGNINANANKNPSTSTPRKFEAIHFPNTQQTAANLLSTPPQNPQSNVYGLLYTLSHRDECLLDRSEGVPFAYTKMYPLITLLSVSPLLAAPTISFLLSLFPGSVSGISGAGLAYPSLLPYSPFSARFPPPLSPPAASQPSQPSQPSPSLQIRALTYIDTQRITPSAPNPEYITRMNRGIGDAISEGFPPSYVRDVMRLCIPAREEK
ncbi:uncharacterized protein EAE97_000245 [Botrytis byssoidea]|uniref:gamma-glutamylcyclotransferase n=1 Tax=Botrytis byssoidea TaxID=139641 RepID=A0A9P5LZC1_9HELO|nr:uncharacterized protein EAE97_000245 [Botrytis byssoidea]KAF7954986.1 hypothetical protein EAE97_000245 [Botrytis byssoidea]